jgi:hypothetical protein
MQKKARIASIYLKRELKLSYCGGDIASAVNLASQLAGLRYLEYIKPRGLSICLNWFLK